MNTSIKCPEISHRWLIMERKHRSVPTKDLDDLTLRAGLVSKRSCPGRSCDTHHVFSHEWASRRRGRWGAEGRFWLVLKNENLCSSDDRVCKSIEGQEREAGLGWERRKDSEMERLYDIVINHCRDGRTLLNITELHGSQLMEHILFWASLSDLVAVTPSTTLHFS